MGKKSPQPSKPYQGPQFGLQEQLLSNNVIGNMLGQQAFNSSNAPRPVWNQGTSYASGSTGGNYTQSPSVQSGFSQNVSSQLANTLLGSGNSSVPYGQGTLMPYLANGPSGQPGGPTLQGGGGRAFSKGGGNGSGAQDPSQFTGTINAPQGFQYAGAPIAGQMGSNTTTGTPMPTTNSKMRYQPYNFFDPGANFTQRNPYQYSPTQGINVADTYTPQMDLARRDIEEMGNQQREAILSDMNKRGMLTSGAANKAIELQYQEQNRKLSDLASQYSIEQGRAQLQEDQMRRQMEQQRQLAQAEEIFRQQGATDEQAKFLASQNVNLQNAQAGQNLSAFGANLGAQQQQYGQGLSNANLLMGQQGQQFQQALQGRQQATAEEQLANLFRRQPLEDLMKMWQQQSGQIGATQGSSGAMGILGPLIGAAASAFI